ncbi:MAG: hypothetical protein ACI8SA_002545 [Dokdonia sp.]|jgi:hypothetical protein
MSENYKVVLLCVLCLQLLNYPIHAQAINSSDAPRLTNLQIEFVLNHKPLVLGQIVFIPEINDSVKIDRLRFYISDIFFSNTFSTINYTKKRFFLIDLENSSSLSHALSLNSYTFDYLHFQVGVDSATQMQGAQGGDLDPMHGMYWSWRNGYVNFKCEGTTPICPGRNNEFIFHIGGFQEPFNSIQRVTLPIYSDSIVVQVDLTPLFTPVNITTNFKVMSPSVKAMELANQLPSLFKSIL